LEKINLDRIILGHNQFYGISHMSLERGEKRRKFFEDVERVREIIDFTSELGIDGLMLSTHDNVTSIIQMISKDKKYRYYPLLPYVRKYLNLYNLLGYFGLFMNIMSRSTLKQKVKFSLRIANPFQKIIFKLIRCMIDIELQPFQKEEVRAVFLHNILTDFLVALKQEEIIREYIKYMQHLGLEPAFCTLNFPSLVQILNSMDVESPLVMAPFNKVGYQMNPSREACEDMLKKNPDYRVIAMSTLASGYLGPQEAYEYIFSAIPQIYGVVVGVSSKKHAEETFSVLSQFIK